MTDYIATRWYRAPEVILSWRKYTAAIDVWSVGCILAEMLTGSVLFPAKNHVEHMLRIQEKIGWPTALEIEVMAPELRAAWQTVIPIGNRVGSRENPELSCLLVMVRDHDAIQCLRRMFHLNPDRRPKAVEVLAMPFLSSISSGSIDGGHHLHHEARGPGGETWVACT